jgi:hypothetical protein
MVVSFTANIGLAKPDETELAANWARFTQLQDDNNDLISANMNIALQTWTPSLIAQTANPNLGVGVAKGDYIDVNGIVMGNFVIPFTDPGVAAGTGEYGISLPQVFDGSFHTVGTALNGAVGGNSVVGNGFLYDSSSVATSGAVAFDAITIGGTTSYLRLITEVFTAPAKTSRLVTNAQPFTPATGDAITGFFIFKKQ